MSAPTARNAGRWRGAPSHLVLAQQEVHLWRIPLARDSSAVAARTTLLSDEERERMARFRFDVHRERFALRRGALRLLLSRYLGTDPRALVLRASAHGKPEVLSGGTSRLRFNLSDSEDLALIAFAWDMDVGVDVEQVRPIPDMDAIARDHFSPDEYAEYRTLPEPQRERGFYHCWTRKEAWLKARGEGLIAGLDGFAVTLAPGRRARLTWVANDPAEAGRWWLHACVPRTGFVAAVAARCRVPRVERFSF